MPRLPSNNNFRIQGKNFFVTYPKCLLAKDRCLTFFKLSSPSPSYIRISKQLHEDGTPHLHVFIQFSNKLHIRDARKWDIQDGNHLYHPNIQTASDPQAVIDFIKKEGDILEEGIYQQQIKGSSNSTNEIWAEILRTSNSASEFLDQCKRLQPKVFFTKLSALQHFTNYEWPPKAEVYVSPYYDFPHLSNTLHEWQLKNVCCFRRPHRPMSLILEGPTGIGKTLWARSLGPHNYFSGRMDFGSYSNDAYYNVIDNINFKHCLHKKELLGAKHDWTANVRYGKPIKIKGGIPCIILCNAYMSWNRDMSPSFGDWFDCNAIYEYVTERLF